MKGFPTDVNILGTPFKVVVEPLADDLAGDTVVTKRLIRIDADMPLDAQVETLYHELAHAIMDHTGVSALLDDKTQEAVAQAFGMSLTQIISMNELPRLEVDSD